MTYVANMQDGALLTSFDIERCRSDVSSDETEAKEDLVLPTTSMNSLQNYLTLQKNPCPL